MKNIYELLKDLGLEIPSDKKETFDKAFTDNYKTVAEVNKIQSKLDNLKSEKKTLQDQYDTDIAARDKDIEDFKKQLSEAGVDKGKIEELTNQLNTMQDTYNTSKTEYEKKLKDQQYEFLVREKVNGLKFTSNGAKKAFIEDVLAKNLQVENDKLLGFDDYVNAYKEEDAGAFVVEESNDPKDNDPKPSFATKTTKVEEPKAEEFINPVIW